ncbi:Fc.00g033530.m01.CDS01 [Cosmosporella sp. VM-42]
MPLEFDLCDENRHFQLVVPILARQHSHLLHSIFALAARHLTRLPKYQTPKGILYQGQLLPSLTEHDAVEYMLKCIPALREFHDTQDDESVESIIATAVILRQLEEIDDEDDRSGRQSNNGESQEEPRSKEQVNFLAIIDAVLRSPPSQTLFGRRSLIQAAYWMGVRQEIYHSITRKQPPQMVLDPEYARGASKANRIVIHTAQVAKWRWADGSEKEWRKHDRSSQPDGNSSISEAKLMDPAVRLQKQGEQLEAEAQEFQPFFSRAADRSNGEVFPTLWYTSDLEVTSIQLSIIAKMVLLAENPYLRTQPTSRAQWREIENEVRRLLLELCGICICHPACPPALVHTAFGLELYGDFFTDQYERYALRGVVDRLRDARAWPVKKLSDMFR